MANKTIKARLQNRTDTAINWTSNNPILLKGEIGVESDTNKMKIGDGSTAWNDLHYSNITDEDLVQTVGTLDNNKANKDGSNITASTWRTQISAGIRYIKTSGEEMTRYYEDGLTITTFAHNMPSGALGGGAVFQTTVNFTTMNGESGVVERVQYADYSELKMINGSTAWFTLNTYIQGGARYVPDASSWQGILTYYNTSGTTAQQMYARGLIIGRWK